MSQVFIQGVHQSKPFCCGYVKTITSHSIEKEVNILFLHSITDSFLLLFLNLHPS